MSTPAFEIKSERIETVRAKRFDADGYLNYYVRLYVEPKVAADLAEVEMVVYVLDPSFGDERYVVSANRRRKFQTEIWSYGYFDAEVKVLLKNGTFVTVQGEVRWAGRVEEEEYT